MKKFIIFLLVISLLANIYLINDKFFKGRDNIGSVSVTSEYTATSTPWDGLQTSHVLVSHAGTLGSFIVTKAGDAEIYLLDATVTPELARSYSQYATDTDMLAHIPANLTAGTYTFDITFDTGLYMYVVGGNTGTSTITWRR